MIRLESFTAVCLVAASQAYTLDPQLPRSAANPFSRTTNYYVNPVFKTELQSSIDSCEAGSVKTYLQGMMNSPSSYWIDRKSVIGGTSTTNTMEGILADAAASGQKKLVVLMIYDLPNRDCHVSNLNLKA